MADAHAKQHDYHLLDPSPWPAVGAASALVLAIGFILFMKGDHNLLLIVPGLLGVFYTMFVWWRDVVKEAHSGYHTPVVQLHLRYGMILFIASEVMFFVAWFWAFFDASLNPATVAVDPVTGDLVGQVARFELTGGTWPPQGTEVFDPWHLPLVNTLILLTSGTTVTWAHHSLLHNNRRGLIWGLILTIALGATFTGIQVYEYSNAAFSFAGNIYGSTFFMATGFHGAHVLIGTIFLTVCLFRARAGHFTPQQHFGFEAAAWYWHFVDVVWLFLFTFVYVWGGWNAVYH
jgi:cytochrome c oxidase subunit 3